MPVILPNTTYRVNEKIVVSSIIHFKSSFTDSIEVELQIGDLFCISLFSLIDINVKQAFMIENPKFEKLVLPKQVLENSEYDSISLLIDSDVIKSKCQLLTDFSKDVIYFYSSLDPYFEFSNFSNFGFEFEGFYYPTVEHFYQFNKFEDKNYADKIRNAKTAKDASVLGKSRQFKIYTDWDERKIYFMRKAIELKFEGNIELQKILLETGDKLLIENSPYDNYWGIGSDGNGFNELGTLLMIRRNLLRS